MESRISLTNMFQNIEEKRNPYRSKNLRRRLEPTTRRFYIHHTIYHVDQGRWKQYVGKSACVYGICSAKNKIENETNITNCASNLT
jgi:hypothetical protein